MYTCPTKNRKYLSFYRVLIYEENKSILNKKLK